MPAVVAVDAGPIVALFDGSDAHHRDAVRFVRQNRAGLFSSVVILAEVMHLLDFSLRAQRECLAWIQAGAVRLIDLTAPDYVRIDELMGKYADVPMDFGDASLVALCERLQTQRIATLDRDFVIYRLHGRDSFENVLPA